MASDNEASCETDPNFAVICSFLEKFGSACGLSNIDFLDLQEMLENTHEVAPFLVDLHIKLLRKLRRSVAAERWERVLINLCHRFNSQDAWELERFGYKKSRISTKLRVLKQLLEMQFDLPYTKLKNELSKISASELRTQPLGRDKLGHIYWFQADDNCQIRVYKEDPDEETWAIVAKDREGLVSLINHLDGNGLTAEPITNEDSNSLEIEKPILDTGQVDTTSESSKPSKKSSEEDEGEDDEKSDVSKSKTDEEDKLRITSNSDTSNSSRESTNSLKVESTKENKNKIEVKDIISKEEESKKEKKIDEEKSENRDERNKEKIEIVKNLKELEVKKKKELQEITEDVEKKKIEIVGNKEDSMRKEESKDKIEVKKNKDEIKEKLAETKNVEKKGKGKEETAKNAQKEERGTEGKGKIILKDVKNDKGEKISSSNVRKEERLNKPDKIETPALRLKPLNELLTPANPESKKSELSGIKEKYIRADNFHQTSNRKAVDSAEFSQIYRNELKRPRDYDIAEPSILKRPRADRPTLLGHKKLQKQYDDEEEEEDEYDSDEVSDEIEEPLMLVTGKGSGADNKSGNSPIVGEEIEEPVFYVYGCGSGEACETGNDSEKKEESNTSSESNKNSHKVDTIIEAKTEKGEVIRSLPKKSRWDVPKSESESNKEESKSESNVSKLVDRFENINKKEADNSECSTTIQKKQFFFGPASGFSFKSPNVSPTKGNENVNSDKTPNNEDNKADCDKNQVLLSDDSDSSNKLSSKDNDISKVNEKCLIENNLLGCAGSDQNKTDIEEKQKEETVNTSEINEKTFLKISELKQTDNDVVTKDNKGDTPVLLNKVVSEENRASTNPEQSSKKELETYSKSELDSTKTTKETVCVDEVKKIEEEAKKNDGDKIQKKIDAKIEVAKSEIVNTPQQKSKTNQEYKNVFKEDTKEIDAKISDEKQADSKGEDVNVTHQKSKTDKKQSEEVTKDIDANEEDTKQSDSKHEVVDVPQEKSITKEDDKKQPEKITKEIDAEMEEGKQTHSKQEVVNAPQQKSKTKKEDKKQSEEDTKEIEDNSKKEVENVTQLKSKTRKEEDKKQTKEVDAKIEDVKQIDSKQEVVNEPQQKSKTKIEDKNQKDDVTKEIDTKTKATKKIDLKKEVANTSQQKTESKKESEKKSDKVKLGIDEKIEGEKEIDPEKEVVKVPLQKKPNTKKEEKNQSDGVTKEIDEKIEDGKQMDEKIEEIDPEKEVVKVLLQQKPNTKKEHKKQSDGVTKEIDEKVEDGKQIDEKIEDGKQIDSTEEIISAPAEQPKTKKEDKKELEEVVKDTANVPLQNPATKKENKKQFESKGSKNAENLKKIKKNVKVQETKNLEETKKVESIEVKINENKEKLVTNETVVNDKEETEERNVVKDASQTKEKESLKIISAEPSANKPLTPAIKTAEREKPAAKEESKVPEKPEKEIESNIESSDQKTTQAASTNSEELTTNPTIMQEQKVLSVESANTSNNKIDGDKVPIESKSLNVVNIESKLKIESTDKAKSNEAAKYQYIKTRPGPKSKTLIRVDKDSKIEEEATKIEENINTSKQDNKEGNTEEKEKTKLLSGRKVKATENKNEPSKKESKKMEEKKIPEESGKASSDLRNVRSRATRNMTNKPTEEIIVIDDGSDEQSNDSVTRRTLRSKGNAAPPIVTKQKKTKATKETEVQEKSVSIKKGKRQKIEEKETSPCEVKVPIKRGRKPKPATTEDTKQNQTLKLTSKAGSKKQSSNSNKIDNNNAKLERDVNMEDIEEQIEEAAQETKEASNEDEKIAEKIEEVKRISKIPEDEQQDIIEEPCIKKKIISQDEDVQEISSSDDNSGENKEEDDEAPKQLTLTSLSFDYTEPTSPPQINLIKERITRKRGHVSPETELVNDESGGKRRKMKGKRAMDTDLRRSIEEQKSTITISSSEDDTKEKNKLKTQSKANEEIEKLQHPRKTGNKKGKRKKTLMGLEMPDKSDNIPIGVRQSRRIAQLKIKEEAERRKLEEIAMQDIKATHKKKSKKDEDKDYKRKRNKMTIAEDDTTNDIEPEEKKKRKRKKKHKNPKFDESKPWQSSSDSSSDSQAEEEEEEQEYEDDYDETPQLKSDHEFSPESDLEDGTEPQPLKRARTVKKEDAIEEEEVDDTNCEKCGKSDHPEWILLCDGCDSGWHCSCLRPPLLVIPEGDWYCPPCQHKSLVKCLQERLEELDKKVSKRKMEMRRKERLAYVGISLDNVLPTKENDEGHSNKHRRERRSSGSESESESGSDSRSSSGSTESTSDSDDEPIYQLRQRRQAHSYRFNDYDDLINSAIREEVEVHEEQQQQQEPQPPVSQGKDMANIIQAEVVEQPEGLPPVVPASTDLPQVLETAPEDVEEEEVIKPVRKLIGRKKTRKLNCLDVSSGDDQDSDEDFKGSSSDEEDDDFDDDLGSDSSEFSRRGRRGGPVRRSTRARISRYDRDFINDDSEDDAPRKKKRSIWDESESEESDRSWGRRKRRPATRKAPTVSRKKKSKKKKDPDDSDVEVFRKKKPKIKYGGLESEEEEIKPRTRGKKINYIDALGTDSEDEVRRRNAIKDEESEDEFVLNEEEDVEDDGVERDSDDSGDGPVLQGVIKSTSKKGKGKGGIKRIKRAQGDEPELFPPLPNPDNPALPLPHPESSALTDLQKEPDPIEQMNKNLEAMDEKEMEMMMEEEEYANKQLQMVAEQLEKEKRRRMEMEARRVEIMPTVVPPPVQMPPMTHLEPVPISMEEKTPKKRGRKPKSVLEPLEGQNAMMQPGSFPFGGSESDKMEPGEFTEFGGGAMSLNPDGTPKKRRGRGKGKKTLEKEAAAAAAAAASGLPPSNLSKDSTDSSDIPGTLVDGSFPSSKTSSPGDSPMHGGKLGVASAPQPFAQTQPKPSVITRMLQAQPGQASYPIGGISHKYYADCPDGMPPTSVGPPGPLFHLGPVGPRGAPPGSPNFRPNIPFAAIRSGPPPQLRSPGPPNIPPHVYSHHTMDPSPTGGGAVTISERSSPSLASPSSASPLSNKGDPTPPPPPYIRPPMIRFPPGSGSPRDILPPHLQQPRPPMPFPGGPKFHYGPYPPPNEDRNSPVPYQVPYPEQYPPDGPPPPPSAPPPEGQKNYDEENGEFGGLVSYFSSQREDDLDS